MAELPALQPEEDLELALRLHRELNAVPRRQRQPARNQAASAALKTLSRKHHPRDSENSSSESERADRGQPRKQGGGSGGTSSDNDSDSKRRRKKEGPGKGRAVARRRAGRKPQHVAAADEARSKAAAADEGQPRTHIKCFYAGLQHGAWLALEALSSRASLAAAVSHVFRDDGVACSSEAATVVFVTPDKQSLEFVGGQPSVKQEQQKKGEPPRNGDASGSAADQWEAAARSAIRVYVR